jgi:hypothetical protein
MELARDTAVPGGVLRQMDLVIDLVGHSGDGREAGTFLGVLP